MVSEPGQHKHIHLRAAGSHSLSATGSGEAGVDLHPAAAGRGHSKAASPNIAFTDEAEPPVCEPEAAGGCAGRFGSHTLCISPTNIAHPDPEACSYEMKGLGYFRG